MAYKLNVVEAKDVPEADTFLSKGELEAYQSFKIEKRRRQWLAGRYALKSMAANYFSFDVKYTEIKNLASGQPILKVPGGTKLPVSISHCDDYAAAAIDFNSEGIGVDIEAVEPRSRAWERQSFCEEEISSRASFFLTELWAKKEAVLKFLGVGLTISMKDVRFINGRLQLYGKALDIWARIGSPNIQVEVKDLDGGYKLAIASEIPVF